MIEIKWMDGQREPQCAPNPAFPNGIDLDTSAGASKTCSVEVPYPAKRCGTYILTCNICRHVIAVTTAGRPDDPRKITMACHGHVLEPNPPGMTEIVLPDSRKSKRTPHV